MGKMYVYGSSKNRFRHPNVNESVFSTQHALLPKIYGVRGQMLNFERVLAMKRLETTEPRYLSNECERWWSARAFSRACVRHRAFITAFQWQTSVRCVTGAASIRRTPASRYLPPFSPPKTLLLYALGVDKIDMNAGPSKLEGAASFTWPTRNGPPY